TSWAASSTNTNSPPDRVSAPHGSRERGWVLCVHARCRPALSFDRCEQCWPCPGWDKASTRGSVHRHEECDLAAVECAPHLPVGLARGVEHAVEGECSLTFVAVAPLVSVLVFGLFDGHLRVDGVGREVARGMAGAGDVVAESDCL